MSVDLLLLAFNIFVIINFISLGILLIKNYTQHLSTKILSLLVFLPIFNTLSNSLLHLANNPIFIGLIIICLGILLLFGPLTLLYIRVINENKIRVSKREIYHLIPVFAIIIYGLYCYTFPKSERLELLNSLAQGESLIISVAPILHYIVYLIWGFISVKRYQQKDHSPNLFRSKWLLFYLKSMVILNVILTIIYGIQGVYFPDKYIVIDLLITPLTALIYYNIIFFKNHTVYAQLKAELIRKTEKAKKAVPKLDKLTKEKLNQLYDNFQKILRENELYTNPNITLEKTSIKLKCSKYQLSKCIGLNSASNFTEIISKFRVQHAKNLLENQDYDHLKIEAIGELSGFKSKSTFYNAFKNTTSLTPSEYRVSKE